MPLPTPSRTVSRRDFPGKLKRNSPELPPKAARMVELMLRGDGNGGAPMNLEEVAAFMGLSWRQARKYFGHPRARQHYDALFAEMRDSEKPKNFHAARAIRDDTEMAKSAAGNRVRLEAADYMDGRTPGGVTVNVGVGINANISPGYMIDVSEHVGQSERILQQARSTGSAIDRDRAAHVIDHEEAETPPRPAPVPSDEPMFRGPVPIDGSRRRVETFDGPLDSRRRTSQPANEP